LSKSWEGKDWKVKVLHSSAGVATQILISTLESDLLIDVGDGTLRDLIKLDYDFNHLKAILITHEHFDHIGGLWSLLGFLRMIGRTQELTLITPQSSSEVKNIVSSFIKVYTRTIHFEIVLNELSDRQKMSIDNVGVQAFSVIHRGSTSINGLGKLIPAFGYSISYNKQRVVASGDTGNCQSLRTFAKDADLAIIEATLKQKTVENAEVHLTVKEASDIGKTAKKYFLIHQES